jgi:sugar O-acyltransferase (sialic acid O-acetyltransferase NeuD family)
MRVLIVGAGGHGEVVADALRASVASATADIELVGFADDALSLWGKPLAGVSVLGSVRDALAHPHDAVVVAIGDNSARRCMMQSLADAGESFATIVHPSATVAPDVLLGPGSVVLAGAVLNPCVRLGTGVIINTCASVDHHSQVADYAHVAPGVHTGGQVSIGEGALVGVGASIVPRCKIAAWAIVGAGATVICDVPAHSTVVGTPARIIRQEEEAE